MSTARQALLKTGLEIEARAACRDDVGFNAACFVSASFPYRAPRTTDLTNGCWVRQNGNRVLAVQGGLAGIPYGIYPRLFLIWLTTETIRTKRRELELERHFKGFCSRLGTQPVYGPKGTRNQITDQIDRVLQARILLTTEAVEGDLGQFLRERFDQMAIADQSSLIWRQRSPEGGALDRGQIILSESFYNYVQQQAVPLDMRAVLALKRSPLALDVYQWLAYRYYSLRRPTEPTWEQLAGQFGGAFGRLRDFKRNLVKALHMVAAVYPDAHFEVTETGLLLRPSSTPVVRAALSRPRRSGRARCPRRDA